MIPALAAFLFAPLSQTARGDALELDGSGDYVTFLGAGVPSGGAPFTIEAWINPTGPTSGNGGGQITFWGNQSSNQSNGFRMAGPSGVAHYFWSNDHIINPAPAGSMLADTTGPNGDGWHHVAITYNGSQSTWYQNGSPIGTQARSGGVNVAAVNHRIGNQLNAEYFHGFIDEVRIWDDVRTPAEIADNDEQTLSGTEPGLVAYFDFEGDYGDRAGSDNNGTPVGNASINAGASAPVAGTGGPVIQSFTATPAARYEGESATLAWDVDDSLVTGSLTVGILAPGGGVMHSSSSASGNHPLTIGDTGGTAQTWTYTLRASESGGSMISQETTVDIDVDPGVPGADDQSLQTVTTTPLPVTLTGTDPNTHPNVSLTFTVTGGPAGGTLSGTAPNLTYTANGGFTGDDSFTFKVDDGKYESPEETVSIAVVPLPSPPSDISLSTTNIGENVLVGGLIAALSSSDPNPGDTHSYALATGVGSSDNASFSIVGNQLRAAASFSGLIGNSFSIRLRSTDGGGLSFEKSFSLTVVEVSTVVVINEVHSNPPNNTVRQEFIELYNPDAVAAELGGWRLSGAVGFVFPNPTTIPAGGYLLIAEDPATLLSTLAATALGPYTGSLNSEGETIRLRDQNDTVVDEVDYKVGFPWPVESNGDGASMELIHPALDNALGSSWRVSAALTPTPGAQNSVFATNAAPNIRKVGHLPEQPTAADPVVITAKVTDPEGVASVNLEYQVVAPGAYVPAQLPLPISGGNINTALPRPDNPAYEIGWVTVAMVDDGSGDDLLPGDDIFTATLPAQAHRTLLRYRITVEDTLGLSARVPYPDDAALNFACFVYDGVPAYEGNSAAVMADTLPVYHLLTRGEDYDECIAYNSADQISQFTEGRFLYNWNGAIVYDGVVYDNIRYRLRGANGRYQLAGKRSMRFRFNDGSHLQARDQFGKKYDKRWRTLTLGKGSSNRLTLTYGLNEAVNFHLFNKLGVPAANTQWLHWRVVDGVDEAPDQWRGDFHGMYFVSETYDVRFLEEHDLEKGNLYKLINQTTSAAKQQRYQGAFAPADGSDHDWIEGQLDGGDSATEIADNVNLDKWNRSHALVQAIRHYDYWPSANKNMVYYFEPDYTSGNGNRGKLWVLPWDTDATWGPTFNSGHDVVYNALFPAGGGGADGNSTPELWPAYFNAVREIRDLLWQSDQIEPLIDEFTAFIAPLEAADASRWKGAPADAGNYGGLHGPGTTSLAAYVQDMKNFAFVGGTWDGGGVGAGGRAAFLDSLQASNGEGSLIPATPTISYTGTAGYPTDGLSFSSTAFSDPQGAGTFGAMEWRVAELTDPAALGYDPTERFKLEIEADWESGELATFNSALALPTVTMRSGHTYRARVRHRDNTGRWSHWSAPHEFTTTLPDISGYLDGLVVSEVMYHPVDPSPAELVAGYDDDDFFEYIEIANVGPVSLDLTDLRFTKGVDFDFLGAAITSLAPGDRALIVANTAAFALRYGGGLSVAGAWEVGDKLDNGGERLKLSFGAGDGIRDFNYDDVSPWPTQPDGTGASLVLREPGVPIPDHTVAANWRSSYALGGTPGEGEASSGFADYQLQHFGPGMPPASGEADDFDFDGLANLLEYLLGSDPKDPTSTGDIELVIVETGSEDYLGLRFTRPIGLTDVAVVLERSTNLVDWDSGPGFTVQEGAPVDNLDGTETVILRSVSPNGGIAREFVRLRAWGLLP
jgi:hypothetical protein